MMVKTRPSDFTRKQRKHFETIMARFGRNDITLKAKSETLNESGKVTDITWTTSTITGDLQYGSEARKVLENFGHATQGDGVFFCSYDVTLSDEDIITVDSVDWELIEKRNLPTTGGSGAAHQEWLVRRVA